jgi:transposase
MDTRQPYPSDLTGEQWAQVERFIPAPKPGGRPAKYERREIVNGLLYLNRTGCQWRALPHDFPPWDTVYW